MIQVACLILLIFSFPLPAELAASGSKPTDLMIFKQKDYYVNKAKLELLRRSRSQLKALLNQAHTIHLEEWRNERQGMVDYLSRKEDPGHTDLHEYTNAKYEGL